MTEVRCPKCDKLLAEGLEGLLYIWCKGCKERVLIDKRDKAVVK